jgi:ABC-type Fe3+-citrate transport system substrate-binding protein
MTEQRRRLADRILDSGRTVAQIVAEALADHERTGEERILDRVRQLVEQRTKLRDERLDLALRYAREGNLGPASSELRWASDLDQQIGALRLLLADAPTVDSPETVPGPDRLGQSEHA